MTERRDLSNMLKFIRGEEIKSVQHRPPRHTVQKWYEAASQTYKDVMDQQHVADRILSEVDRVIDLVDDNTIKNKLEVDHRLEVKIRDVQFKKEQIRSLKTDIEVELDALRTNAMRLQDAQANLGPQAIEICKKCMELREGRIGIDLCVDEVDIELAKELTLLNSVQDLISRLREEVNEQMRRLRSMVYTLVHDLDNKVNVVSIDKGNLSINENSFFISLHNSDDPLESANFSLEEWESHTNDTLQKARKELDTGRPIRSYTDVIMQQAVEDLWKMYENVTSAFRRRIDDYKEAKNKLEHLHSETVRQINELTMKMTSLRKTIDEKEQYAALAHTRLGNRSKRLNYEMCRDEVEIYLLEEIRHLKEDVNKLQQMIQEAYASQRYLLQSQVRLEEELNIKTNSLKIDEVECMSLRAEIVYNPY